MVELVKQDIKADIAHAVSSTVAKPSVKADMSAAPAIIDAVATKIIPQILNSTNNEPWWQSRITWAAILSIVGSILGIVGVTYPEELQGQTLAIIMSAIPLIAGVYSLYGRWVAKKPIGQ